MPRARTQAGRADWAATFVVVNVSVQAPPPKNRAAPTTH